MANEISIHIYPARIKRLTKAQRRDLIHALAQRLTPITPSQVGMMLDTNDLMRAHHMMERHNQHAYNEFRERVRHLPSNDHPKFEAPFWWSPNDPDAQQGKWTIQLREAFDAHL